MRIYAALENSVYFQFKKFLSAIFKNVLKIIVLTTTVVALNGIFAGYTWANSADDTRAGLSYLREALKNPIDDIEKQALSRRSDSPEFVYGLALIAGRRGRDQEEAGHKYIEHAIRRRPYSLSRIVTEIVISPAMAKIAANCLDALKTPWLDVKPGTSPNWCGDISEYPYYKTLFIRGVYPDYMSNLSDPAEFSKLSEKGKDFAYKYVKPALTLSVDTLAKNAKNEGTEARLIYGLALLNGRDTNMAPSDALKYVSGAIKDFTLSQDNPSLVYFLLSNYTFSCALTLSVDPIFLQDGHQVCGGEERYQQFRALKSL